MQRDKAHFLTTQGSERGDNGPLFDLVEHQRSPRVGSERAVDSPVPTEKRRHPSIPTSLVPLPDVEEVVHRAHFQGPPTPDAPPTREGVFAEVNGEGPALSATAFLPTHRDNSSADPNTNSSVSALAQLASEDEPVDSLASFNTADLVTTSTKHSAQPAISVVDCVATAPVDRVALSSTAGLSQLSFVPVMPPEAIQAIWAFVLKEQGARRNPLVVAAALPADLSVVALSAEFPEVYRSLLLAYHLQHQLVPS